MTSDWDKFQKLVAGSGTYSMETFITLSKGKMFDIDGGLDIAVESTTDPSVYKEENDKGELVIVSHPVKDTAVRRLLRSLIKQERCVAKNKALGNKMAYYVYTDVQLAERGISEDNEELRAIMNTRKAKEETESFVPLDDDLD